LKRSILRGASHGFMVWLVYGVAELVLACGPQLFSSYQVEVAGWQWRLIAILFGVYTLAGIALGAVGGALLAFLGRGRSQHSYHVLALISLVFAFAANLISHPLSSAATRTALAAAILFGTALFWTLTSRAWSKELTFLVNPWMACLFLLSGPWASHVVPAGWSAVRGGVAALLLLASILVMALVWHRFRSGRLMSIRQQAVTTVVVMKLLFCG
jgi:hypothetical protein